MQENTALLHVKGLGFSEEAKTLQNLRLLNETPFKEHIEELINLILTAPSPDDAMNNMERVVSQLYVKSINAFIADREKLKNLVIICGSSNLLSNTIVTNLIYAEQLFLEQGLYKKKDITLFLKELEMEAQNLSNLNSAATALRLYKQKEYLRIGTRDILGLASMQETTLELSDLASACLEIAYRFCLKQLKAEYGTPLYKDIDDKDVESEFAVIGMGKLGGRELNFNSDIDIIYIYSSDKGETSGIENPPSPPFTKGGMGGFNNKISLHAFYVKLSEMITKIIGNVTEDGIVFRVDLNLRPEGKGGDLANSIRSAEIYYESWGQAWERAAMIKARVVAGSLKLGEAFLSMIEPFVYRRYLDFTAIEEIRGMKEKIDVSLLRAAPDAVDVKLGVGGIREIEFFVQAIQLINGGKDKAIREKNSLRAIELLKQKGYINEQDASAISNAYIFLRNLEHRIQIVEGRQTQVIPSKAGEIERLARMLGFEDTASPTPLEAGGKISAAEQFRDEYKKQTNIVHEIYNTLFFKASKDLDEKISKYVILILGESLDKQEVVSRLSQSGFHEPEAAYENLKLLKDGPPFAHFPVRTKMLLKKIAPFLLTCIMESPAPDMALNHLERFLSAIGARTTFYSLLAENRKVMELLVKLFGTSIFLSMAIIEHPENIDTLLSPELNKPFKNKQELLQELSAMLDAAADHEEHLDCIRRFRNGEILRIGIHDIFEELKPAEVSRQITCLADVCLIKAYEISLLELKKRFGTPGQDDGENAQFAVLALGKMGSEELIYSSDLDIIFIYSKGGETSGPKVISNHEFFAKLSQRIISTLSIITREGVAFKIDARLRPSGSSGPLVISEDTFIKYHKETAHMWEKQAMLKAKFAAGDDKFGAKVLDEIQKHIYAAAPNHEDLKELYRIRKRMEAEIAKEDFGKYNIKFGKGGLVDVEFAVQVLQLKFGRQKLSIRKPNTADAIHALKDIDIISKTDYEILINAYNFYRLLENRLRIVQNRAEGEIVKDSRELLILAKRLGYKGEGAGAKLLEDYLSHAAKVRNLYERVMNFLVNCDFTPHSRIGWSAQ
ncbi:MAG: bifunctional [glutamate--ammonia ligase]-adenylyl-L-tyrosine phosphorylase/[glutamate--ammonia-ligase] adenylyltransferase [Deltaproteobacteria bacterium]|nr:bifunctional [glutamate--ammonia ligase]-adenylyl-L-tyrosine phosphorylase/[glutamate--ammonia-ligase] adenylyltransferase [Deltaproteobacteria bacterium]